MPPATSSCGTSPRRCAHGRRSDLVARTGGDEFAIVLPEGDAAAAAALAADLASRLDGASVGWSVGVRAVEGADRAMYEHKRAKREVAA